MTTTPHVKRLRYHLEVLERGDLTRAGRMDRWRLIQDLALNAHDLEVRELDELNSAVVDPEYAAFGSIIV